MTRKKKVEEPGIDIGRLILLIAIVIGGYFVYLRNKDNKPEPTPVPVPITSDFPEPDQTLKAALPDMSKYISGRKALDLAYLYKNLASEVEFNDKITRLEQISAGHLHTGNSIERNNKEDVKLGVGKALDDFMISNVIATMQDPLSAEEKKAISNGLRAIAWGFYIAAGEEGIRDLSQSMFTCDEDQCNFDKKAYLEFIQGISSSSSEEERKEIIDNDGHVRFMQFDGTDDNLIRGPPVDNALLNGLITDPVELEQFNSQIPKFQQFGYNGSGEGQTVLLYESLLKYDPEAFTERQVTGDCGVGYRNNMNLVGTEVVMSNGQRKAIEDVKVGELVINSYNEISRVKSVFNKKYTGDLIEIKVEGNYNIATFTPDHLFIVCDKGQLVWKRLDQIKIKDKLLIPFGTKKEQIYSFDLQELDIVDTENNRRRVKTKDGYVRAKGGRHHIKRYVTLDEDLGWLFGIFFAEGGIRYENEHPMGVDFSLNRNETEYAENIKRIFKDKFDYDVTFYDLESKPSVRIVRVNSAILGEFFAKQCPGKINTKSLTTCIFQSPLTVRKAVLKGWIDGDGHISKIGYITATSISENLANDMAHLAKSVQIDINLSKRTGKPNDYAKTRQDSYTLNIRNNNRYKLYDSFIVDEEKSKESINAFGFERAVKSIRRIPVKDIDVYCIEVPNKSSFIANGIAVHNCTSHGTRNGVDMARAYEIDKLGEAEAFVLRGATEAVYGYRGHGGQGMSVVRAMEYISEVGGLAIRKNYTDAGIDFSKYDPKEAIQWGRSGGTPKRLNDLISSNRVVTISLINSAEEARDAISNGFAIVSGSQHSFASKRDEYGFAARDGKKWGHCTAWGGLATLKDLTNGKNPSEEPCFLYINSWGDWNGGPKGKYNIPDGSFWITKDDAEFMIRQKQTYAVGQVQGFKAEKIQKFGFEWLD